MRRPLQLPTFTPEELFQLPAEAWNSLIDRLVRSDLISIKEGKVSKGGHAWKTRVAWDPDRRQWKAKVLSGIVNWEEAVVSVEDKDGLRSDVPLSLGPDIWMRRFRPVVDMPPYFAARYRFRPVEAFQGDLDFGGGVVRNPIEEAAARADGGWRSLWSCSLFVTARRPQTTFEYLPDGRIIMGVSGAHEEVFRVGNAAEAPEQALPTPLMQLRDGLRDPGQDVQPICTVYLLSPPGADPTKEPDGTFQAFVEQHCFYHLRHAVRAPDMPPEGIDVSIGYTGYGGEIIRQMLQDLARQDSFLNATITQSQVLGRFWSV
jgi:hypothetical protein